MAKRYILVTAGFAGFFLVFFVPAMFGGNFMTVAGDGSNIALPAYLVPHGFWEPDIMLGYPWASNFNGYWDPFFLLHFIPHSFNAYMLCAYVIAAVGAFGCVDSMTRSTIGGVVAGLSYALGGFMIGHFGHYDIVHAAAWTPYVFWALFVQRQSNNLVAIVLGSVAIALCAVSGQPQVLAYTLLFAVAYAVFAGRDERSRVRQLSGAFLTIALGVSLASITLIPGLILAFASFRAHASLQYFLAYSIPVWQIPIRLFFPYLVGKSDQPLYHSNSVDYGNDAEYSGYVGIITVSLAMVAALTKWSNRDVRFLVISSCLALILSAGDGFGIASVTFHIPLLNLFRAQGRHMLEFTLFASLLAGFGAAELARGELSIRRLRIALFASGCLLLAATAIAFAEGLLSSLTLMQTTAFWIPVGIFVMTVALLTYFAGATSSRLLASCLVLFTALDLSSFAWFSYWRSPVNEKVLTPPPIVATLKSDLDNSHQRIFSVSGADPSSGIPPNLSLVWGIPSAGGYVQLLLTGPGIFLQLFPQGTIAPELLANGSDQSFDLAAIKYLVIPPAQAAAFMKARPGWSFLQQSSVGSVLVNLRAAPRVRIFHDVVSMSIDETLSTIRANTIDTTRTAILQGARTLKTRAAASDFASIVNLSSDVMTVSVACVTDCFLETSDTYNGMWNVAIDGARTSLRLTDYTFRGVFVPAGKHLVAFTYRPWPIYVGAILSLVSMMLLATLPLWGRILLGRLPTTRAEPYH